MGVVPKLKAKVKSNLGAILEERGLRLKWVAEKIDATQSQVTNWCKNENEVAKSTPNIVYIIRLENLLGVKAGEMFEIVKEE